MQNEGIIRNRAKLQAAIKNAKAFLEVQKERGSFDAYIRSFSKGKVINNKLKSLTDAQATSPLSDALAKDMKKRGFSFV